MISPANPTRPRLRTAHAREPTKPGLTSNARGCDKRREVWPRRAIRPLAAAAVAGATLVALSAAAGHSAGPAKGCASSLAGWTSGPEELVEPNIGQTSVTLITTPIPRECDMTDG